MNKTKVTAKKTIKQPSKNASLAYHIVTSFLSVAPHPHSGRALHHRNTSHGALLIALLITGVLLFSNLGALKAYGVTNSGSHTVTVNVAGAPPTVGADIIFPTHDSLTQSNFIEVRGTCEAGTLVAVYNNGVFAGSTMCTPTGEYAVTITLQIGTNILQSQNYDGLNQAGPITTQVIITRQAVVDQSSPNQSPTFPAIALLPQDITSNPSPPLVDPAPQPAINPCFNDLRVQDKASLTPIIYVSCIHRTIFVGETLNLPMIINGGLAPYALKIDWGNDVSDLKSITDSTYRNFQHRYENAGTISIQLRTTDARGNESFLQTIVQVNGSPLNTGSNFASITDGFESIWTDAPVPLYWVAVTLVLGFWIGDIFQRYFRGKKTKIVHRRRHA
ncbi:hypothetical protein H7200_02325 [Candidatus Saccharibacteria bacterium]|nr:hypothetical protein [Candidatus Saccharibacteria bacterium]